MHLLILHGPNLNLLGEREPEVYGSQTLDDINDAVKQHAQSRGHDVRIYQSNHEGDIVDYLHKNRFWANGIVINPGALTHYSYVLRDAIASVEPPCVEVHLSDISEREDFRKISVIKDVCVRQIKGKGLKSYFEAIDYLSEDF